MYIFTLLIFLNYILHHLLVIFITGLSVLQVKPVMNYIRFLSPSTSLQDDTGGDQLRDQGTPHPAHQQASHPPLCRPTLVWRVPASGPVLLWPRLLRMSADSQQPHNICPRDLCYPATVDTTDTAESGTAGGRGAVWCLVFCLICRLRLVWQSVWKTAFMKYHSCLITRKLEILLTTFWNQAVLRVCSCYAKNGLEGSQALTISDCLSISCHCHFKSHVMLELPWHNCTGWLGVKHQLTYLCHVGKC